MKKYLLFLIIIAMASLIGCGKNNSVVISPSKDIVANNNIASDSDIQKTEETINTVIEPKEDPNDFNKITQEKLREAFLNYIVKESNSNAEGKLEDYSINSIQYFSDEEKKSIADEKTILNSDMIANITYSVLPENKNSSFWTTKGTKNDKNWIAMEKTVIFRDFPVKINATSTLWRWR